MKRIIFYMFIWAFTCVQLFATEHWIKVSGHADFLNTGDTISITVSPYAGRLNEFNTSFTVRVKESGFLLEIPAYDNPRFILIRFNKQGQKDLGPYMIFPGDDLDFAIQRNSVLFKGPSGKRFDVQQQLEGASTAYKRQFKIIYAPDALALSFVRIDSCAAIRLNLLESKKAEIGESSFTVLRNSVIAGAVTSKLGYVTYGCLNRSLEVQENYIAALRKYGRLFNNYPSFVVVDSLGRPTSNFSGELIYQQYLVDSCILAGRKFNLHDCYLYESRNFKGETREQLLTELFIMKRNNPKLSASDVGDALVSINDPGFRAELEKIRSINTAGAIAPDFVLRDETNKPVQLKDFRGKLVILDFWFTGCGACKALAPTLFALERKYKKKAVVFLSISIDKSREQWLATLKTNEYASPLAVKLYTEEKGDLHKVIRDLNVHGYPTIIMIDREGKVCPRPELNEQGLSATIDRFL